MSDFCNRVEAERALMEGVLSTGVSREEAARAIGMALDGLEKVLETASTHFGPIPAGPEWTIGYGLFCQLLENQAHNMGEKVKRVAAASGFVRKTFPVGVAS